MILYRLCCNCGHEFDSWFRNGAAFDKQSAKGALSCPACGGNEVGKAVMAPRLNRGTTEISSEVTMRDTLRQIRRKIESECDYVGPAFAEEARAIHNGTAEKRGIYGEASVDETKSLQEDGIDVAVIPWVPAHDA